MSYMVCDCKCGLIQEVRAAMRQQLQEKRADQALLRQLQTANKGLDAELKSVKAELRAVAEEQKAATALAEEQKVRSCSHMQLDSVSS